MIALGCASSDAPTAPPPPPFPIVTTIKLLPEVTSVSAGHIVQFQVAAHWSDGATTAPALNWKVVGGGEVDVYGVYVAPPSQAAVMVIASLQLGGMADTSIVNVEPPAPSDSTGSPPDSTGSHPDTTGTHPDSTQTPPPPDSTQTPPPPDSTQTPPPPPPPTPPPPPSIPVPQGLNQPPGYSPIVGRAFNTLGTGKNGRGVGALPFKTTGSEGFDDVEGRYPTIALVQDSSAPISPTSIVRMLYPAQGPISGTYNPGVIQTLGFNSGSTYGGVLKYRKLYVRTAFRVSANWQGHPTGTNKLFFIRGNGNVRMEPIVRLRGAGSGALELNVDLQGSPRDKRNIGVQSSLSPNQGVAAARAVTRGEWHIVEIVLEIGTNGQADGRLQLWLDGVLTHDYADIEYEPLPLATWYWDVLHVSPTWGGGGGTINQLMWLDYDDFFVSGAP